MSDYMPRKCLSALPRMPEAERIAALEAEIARLQEIVAHYMRMFPTGEAALDALVELEEETSGDANQAD